MKKPNIIFILTDQQSATMMSCAGNKFMNTPAMDSMAENGMRFERAYCTNPVCVPSRFSLMTGRMPSEIELRANWFTDDKPSHVSDHIKNDGLGWLLQKAGYETSYGGKVHLPEKITPAEIGFEHICRDARDELADVCADYITKEHDKPFCLVASFINPHDICYMAISEYKNADKWNSNIVKNSPIQMKTLKEAMELPEGVSKEEFFEKYCPPLPPNYEPQEDEPEAISALQAQRPFKKLARAEFTDEQWRMHRWAYCKLTEKVDAQIAKILNAVEESGQAENTVIIFSSDHGDMDSAHRMEHKTALYEEACRIPLIVSQTGVTPKEKVDKTHLISNGLDLFPTICDYAGIEPPEGLQGKSFRPIAEGQDVNNWRTVLPVESEFGRMVVTDRYKYILYDEGKNREQLMDLEKDLYEMKNSANEPENEKVLKEHRMMFSRSFR